MNNNILELVSWRFPMTLLYIAMLWLQIEYFIGVVVSDSYLFNYSSFHPFFNALLTIVLNFFWFAEDIHIVLKWFLALNRVVQMWFSLTNNYIGPSRGNQPLTSTSSFLKFRFWVTLPFLRYLTPYLQLNIKNWRKYCNPMIDNLHFMYMVQNPVETDIIDGLQKFVEEYGK